MNQNPLISVIVPVYKVEKWLSKCVRSLCAQSYANIEIILVDDGSPDNCPRLCDRLAHRDTRIKVLHKENGGVSSARNAGIDLSQGQYLMFVDADDWLPVDAIERLFSQIRKHNVQISSGNIAVISRRNGAAVKSDVKLVDFNNKNQLFYDLQEDVCACRLLATLFDASIIKQNAIRFDTNVKFGEDLQFVLECFLHCKTGCFSTDTVYYYNRLVEESAITRYYPEIISWMLMLTQRRLALVEAKGNSFIAAEQYVMRNALIDFEFLINYIALRNRNETDAVRMYRQVYEAFKVYIAHGEVEKHGLTKVIGDPMLLRYCYDQKFKELYLSKFNFYHQEAGVIRITVRMLGRIYSKLKAFWYRYVD